MKTDGHFSDQKNEKKLKRLGEELVEVFGEPFWQRFDFLIIMAVIVWLRFV